MPLKPRDYHSPSSLSTGKACALAWWYEYREGRRSPHVTWADIVAGKPYAKRQRAAALGVEVHERFEAWYRGESFRGDDLPGLVALSGVHLLPHPTRCSTIYSEGSVGLEPMPSGVSEHAPATRALVHGVWMAGKRDLVVHSPEELARLEIVGDGSWVLYDYKSTSSIAKWAKSAEQLREDVAANLYAWDTCMQLDLRRIPCRWLYLETGQTRRALPVDFVIERDEALQRLAAPAQLARELDAMQSVDDAEPNTLSCGNYGGCPHHATAGGPCRARRATGALIQSRLKRNESSMTDLKAKFAAAKAKRAAALAATKGPAVEEPSDAPDIEEPTDTEAATEAFGAECEDYEPPVRKPTKRTRQRKPAKTAAAPPPTEEQPSAPVSSLVELAQRLEDAQASVEIYKENLEKAQASVEAIKTTIREALS